MYITYETTQYSFNEMRSTKITAKPVRTMPNMLPKPDFMPTKLVRISDMRIVNGSRIREGYCALSYSWNQSGEILYDETTGTYERIDEGKHKITSYDNNMYPEITLPLLKTKNARLFKIYQVLNIMDAYNYYFAKTTKYVKFEGIIQQICQQFNIKYIWFDQMCIKQEDKIEKQREIRNMHDIYGNAYCTVALVPEYSEIHGFDNPEHFKRLWTLEEAIKSKIRNMSGERNCHKRFLVEKSYVNHYQKQVLHKSYIMHINEKVLKNTTAFLHSSTYFQNLCNKSTSTTNSHLN